MNVPIRLQHGKGGRRALAISLILHALLAIPLLCLPAPSRKSRDAESSDVCIALFEGDQPEITVAAAPPSGIMVTLTPNEPSTAAEPARGSVSHSNGNSHDAGVQGASATNTQGAGPASAFFPAVANAKSVVYVIDRSSSMGFRGALDIARIELLKSLETLPATASFQVIVFNQTARPLIPARVGLQAATAENRRAVAAALEQLLPVGGTRHEDALPLALAFAPDVIFFLTDADDLTEEYVRGISTRNRARSIIHTIELSTANRQRSDMPLQLLARYNRGTYRAVDLVR